MLNIAQFRAQVNATGWAVQNRYDVTIYSTALAKASTIIFNANNAILQYPDEAWDWMADYYGGDPVATAVELTAYCQQSELPSYQYQMETSRSYGPSFKIPHKPEYNDLTMTFMCGAEMNERWFFDAWMYMVMDPQTNNFNYIHEYSTDICISSLEEDASGDEGSGSITITPNYTTWLIDAFPISIAAQTLNYGNDNVVQTIQVTFTYKFANGWDGGSGVAAAQAIRSASGSTVPFQQTIVGAPSQLP